MTLAQPIHVLVIEDDPDTRANLAFICEESAGSDWS